MSRLLKGDAARSTGSLTLPSRATTRAPAPAAPAQPSAAALAAAPAAPPMPSHESLVAQALAAARPEIEARRARAREEGLEEGRREASGLVRSEIERHEAALRASLASIEGAVARKLESVEELAVAIAFEACARVLGEGALDGSTVSHVVRRLLGEARESLALRIQLPPADLEPVKRALREDSHWSHRTLSFEADPSLGPGECRVVSAHGQLEAGLEVQLAAIQRALLEAHAAREAGLGGRT